MSDSTNDNPFENLKDDEIYFVRQSASFIQLIAQKSLLMEVHEDFTFPVPGYQFMPAFKAKKWDGKKRLLNLMNQTLPAGLLGNLKTFAKERKYTVKEYLLEPEMEREEITPQLIESFLKSLPVHSKGIPINHHPHQKEAIYHCIKNNRVTVSSPTSSGKSLIIYSILRWFLKENSDIKILLIVPTVSLVLQMYSDFEDYSSEDDSFDSEENTHKIYSGQEKDSKKSIIISTWQSMQTREKDYFEKFDMVLCDEVHLAAANVISKIMEASVNAHIRFGFTGTLQDAKCHKLIILGHFGAEKRVIETKELMDMGLISKLLVKCVIFKYSNTDAEDLNKRILAKKRSGASNGYQTEIDFINSHTSRMNNLVALVLSLKNNSLVLFSRVDTHGKVLYNKLKDMNEKHSLGKKILYISGETDADLREETRGVMEENDNVILVASMGTCSTGMNIKNIHNVVAAAPSKSKIKILQSIGRGLRKNENKEGVIWYDVVDDISRTTKKGNLKQNYALLHFAERFNIYKSEKFEFKVITKSI